MPDSRVFTLYAMESALLGTSLFKVYANRDGLHFGRVSDRYWDEHTQAGQKLLALEKQYESLELGGPEFLAVDKRNASVCPYGMQSIKLAPLHFWMVQPQRVGYLDLLLGNGKKRKFMLFSSLRPEQVETAIRAALPNAQGSLS